MSDSGINTSFILFASNRVITIFSMNHDKISGGILEKGDVTEGDSTTFTEPGSVINASGHSDQLTRQYGLVGLTGIAVTVNNAWVVLGSSISVSILSGGISGVIYGLMVAVFYYAFIGLSLAEVNSTRQVHLQHVNLCSFHPPVQALVASITGLL
jgi:hypothetical protein